jgi:hypothetical protein
MERWPAKLLIAESALEDFSGECATDSAHISQ